MGQPKSQAAGIYRRSYVPVGRDRHDMSHELSGLHAFLMQNGNDGTRDTGDRRSPSQHSQVRLFSSS